RPGGGVYRLMDVEETDARIAVVTALRPGHLADLSGLDGLMRLPERIVRRGVGPHLQRLFRVPSRDITELDRLIRGMRHRLFAVDMLSGLQRILGDFGMPVVRRRNENG